MEVPHINLHFATLVINSCDTDSNDWVRYHQVHSVHDDLTQKSMYIRHSSRHFDIVLSIQ